MFIMYRQTQVFAGSQAGDRKEPCSAASVWQECSASWLCTIHRGRHRQHVTKHILCLERIGDPNSAACRAGGNVVAGGEELVADVQCLVRCARKVLLQQLHPNQLVPHVHPHVAAAIESTVRHRVQFRGRQAVLDGKNNLVELLTGGQRCSSMGHDANGSGLAEDLHLEIHGADALPQRLLSKRHQCSRVVALGQYRVGGVELVGRNGEELDVMCYAAALKQVVALAAQHIEPRQHIATHVPLRELLEQPREALHVLERLAWVAGSGDNSDVDAAAHELEKQVGHAAVGLQGATILVESLVAVEGDEAQVRRDGGDLGEVEDVANVVEGGRDEVAARHLVPCIVLQKRCAQRQRREEGPDRGHNGAEAAHRRPHDKSVLFYQLF
mmetsp:Transcript_19693/g.33791  ORF Transcript_19693/g.33791 Transcript_19693/m.33791 type:complete len:384 (+) Transcript_19693:95-1246(+)